MYRSKDIDYMNDLKKKTNEQIFYAGQNNFNSAWEHLRKYIVLDDLNVYLRSKYAVDQFPYIPEYVFNTNYNRPDYMFITASENPQELAILKSIVNKAGIKNYYRTSYIKHSNLIYYKENSDLTSVLVNEIKIVKPKYIVYFGLNIAKWGSNINERHIIMDTGDSKIVATSALLDLLSNKIDEKSKINIKHLIWRDVVTNAGFLTNMP